ncbi:DinB family protein [Nakamurella endophytica]|uniref:DinB-like domain-containing protein n=1 Tax=Nakamurella endophytica TaxID=1748367 RepID=A0A917SX88_9ACTN|nr:DinB family protein [Nakamurella endophytica]GGM02542.1 hypothetical protein GCM10011594_23310 [Nakamurella endophytica]
MAERTVEWVDELLEQLSFEWDHQLRPRWSGLTDDEYLWEPVPGMWSVRPRGQAVTPRAAGGGDWVADFDREPDPAPVTTIAWRVGHLLVGIYGDRLARHFGGPPVDYGSYDYPSTAADALARLDDQQAAWVAGIRSLSVADLARPCGEPGFEQDTLAALLLHINREIIHHGAEISLLRDLYRWWPSRGSGEQG